MLIILFIFFVNKWFLRVFSELKVIFKESRFDALKINLFICHFVWFSISYKLFIVIKKIQWYELNSEACRAQGYMPLMNQIMAGKYRSSKYAPVGIQKSKILPLMKKNSHGGKILKTSFSLFIMHVIILLCILSVMPQGFCPYLWMESAHHEKNPGHASCFI